MLRRNDEETDVMKKDGPGNPKHEPGTRSQVKVLGGPGATAEELGEKKPLIEYPSVYTFKTMGRQAPDFVEYVLALFQRLLEKELGRDVIREQPSSGGRYVSLSVSVLLESEEQRRSIYEALHRDERVVYYL